MRPVKNKRRIDPRYFLEETVDRDNLDEQDEGKEHDEDCDCTKCPEPKKKKKGKDKNGRELIQGEKELSEDEEDTDTLEEDDRWERDANMYKLDYRNQPTEESAAWREAHPAPRKQPTAATLPGPRRTDNALRDLGLGFKE